jgi:hypothetical protein
MSTGAKNSIREGCHGGCGRVLARYSLCEACERAMKAAHQTAIDKYGKGRNA